MPPIFKALASIAAWTLFVIGCLAVLANYVRLIGLVTGLAEEPPGAGPIWAGIVSGAIFLTLSVVVMKLRQMLE